MTLRNFIKDGGEGVDITLCYSNLNSLVTSSNVHFCELFVTWISSLIALVASPGVHNSDVR